MLARNLTCVRPLLKRPIRPTPQRLFSHFNGRANGTHESTHRIKPMWTLAAFAVGSALALDQRRMHADAPVRFQEPVFQHKVYDKLADEFTPIHPADLATGWQRVWNKTQFWLRTVATIAGAILSTTVIIPITIVNYLIGNSANTFKIAGTIWYYILSPITGINVQVEGMEHLTAVRPCVMLVVPHQSAMDVLVASKMCTSGLTCFGKKEIGYIPIFNIFAWLSPMFLIDRKNHSKALESMNKAVEVMKRDNLALLLFPEGTRSRTLGNKLLPLKKGGFHIALDHGFPIVPIVIENYADLYYSKKQWWKSGTIKVKVLPPIETASLNTARDLDFAMKTVRERMSKYLTRMSDKTDVLDD